MPEWNTTERGITREDQNRTFGDEADYDGLSCMVGPWWPHANGGYGVEDTTMLHGLGLKTMEDDDSDEVP